MQINVFLDITNGGGEVYSGYNNNIRYIYNYKYRYKYKYKYRQNKVQLQIK